MAEVWLVGIGDAAACAAISAALAARRLTPRLAHRWPHSATPAVLIAEAAPGWPERLARSRAAGWGGALLLVAADPVAALDDGADDAVGAAASAEEIAARAGARVRERSSVIRHGPLVLDRTRRQASVFGLVLRLRPREWLLLHHLALARRVVSRGELLRAFGLGIDPGTNVIAVQVSRLRAELARAGAGGLVETVAGGYRLRAHDLPALPSA